MGQPFAFGQLHTSHGYSRMTIHVALAFDKNYLAQSYALITSLFQQHKQGELAFHVIATGLSADEIRALQAYVHQEKHGIQFYSVDESTINKFVLINQWTHAVYLRLFFPLIVPTTVSTIIYLDVDTIVTNPLYELWKMDVGMLPLAAVYDNYVKTQPLLGITKEGEYFNSGVMLINIPRWNALAISEKAMAYLHHNPEKILFVDQCGLNAVLKGLWMKLPSKFNFMYPSVPATASKRELKNLLQNIVVVHYTLQRPWHMLCRNRLAYLYHDARQASPVASWSPRYTDFSFNKLPTLFRIKLLNLYFDLPWLGKLWRKLNGRP
jgi:lipopolysaccharide biosynthesis glycosyltransferase